MLTEEQQLIVDEVCSSNNNDKIIAVNAVAGSGKTATSSSIIETYKPKNGFYTAFNKTIVTDSAIKFGHLLDCRTIHSLAYKYVKPKRKIEDLTYSTIKEDIEYLDKELIINTIDDFFRSSYLDINDYLNTIELEPLLQSLVIKYIDLMIENKIPPTFNYLLKHLHFLLVEKQVEIENDLLILDECQDTTAVTLEIFKLINANKKVILGDKHQNIYSFMNTVNAFDLLEDNINEFKLTKSFRCNESIANIVDKFGKQYLEDDFNYKGNENLQDKNLTTAYISRTNSSLIERMYQLINEGKSFTTTRSINEIFAFPIALLNANYGNKIFDKKYKFLETEYTSWKLSNSNISYFDYLLSIIDTITLKSAIKVLLKLKSSNINLYDLKNKVQNLKPNPNIILTTAHAFKGLEADICYIENDLNKRIEEVIYYINSTYHKNLYDNYKHYKFTMLSKQHIEELNTYYVALSRARSTLLNVNY